MRGDTAATVKVASDHRRAETEFRIIGNGNRIRLILGDDHRRDRPKNFLLKRRHAGLHIGQHGRRIPGPGLLRLFTAAQHARAGGDTALDLLMQFVAPGDRIHWTELCCAVARIAHPESVHCLNESLLELVAYLLDDDETFAGNAALAGIDHARSRATFRRLGDIGVFEHHVRIAAAEFEHAFLQPLRGGSRNLAAGLDAACERHRLHFVHVDHGFDVAARDEQRAKHVVGETCIAEHAFDRQRTARHIACVFQYRRIAGHQRRRGEAEDLPERKIPWHDRQDHAERLEGDERFRAAEIDLLPRQETPSVIGEIIASRRAFLDFGAPVGDRLAHLLRHQRGELILLAAQDSSGFLHHARALGIGAPAPFWEGAVDRHHYIAHLRFGAAFVEAALLSRRRIFGFEARPRLALHVGLRDGLVHGRASYDGRSRWQSLPLYAPNWDGRPDDKTAESRSASWLERLTWFVEQAGFVPARLHQSYLLARLERLELVRRLDRACVVRF